MPLWKRRAEPAIPQYEPEPEPEPSPELLEVQKYLASLDAFKAREQNVTQAEWNQRTVELASFLESRKDAGKPGGWIYSHEFLQGLPWYDEIPWGLGVIKHAALKRTLAATGITWARPLDWPGASAIEFIKADGTWHRPTSSDSSRSSRNGRTSGVDTSRYSEREIVYVLERLTSEGRFFKIGKTNRNDVSRRAYEVKSTVVSYTNEVRERHVHRELRRSRINRSDLPAEITDDHGPTEWFRPTEEVERFAFDGVLPSGRTATMVAG